MKNFEDLDPRVYFLYFIAVVLISAIIQDPIIILFTLLSALLSFFVLTKRFSLRGELAFFALFVFMSLINPLFSHNGATVLLVVNDRPITLEALLYGVYSSALIIAVIYIFRLFSHFMTEDKLFFLLGKSFPKLSMILSGAIRYTSLLSMQKRRIEDAHTAIGGYRDNSLPERISSSLKVFSCLTTWSLENSIISADSMSARGYGVGRRSFYSVFRMSVSDVVFLAATLLLSAATVILSVISHRAFVFYPEIKMSGNASLMSAMYIAYFLLSLMPIIYKITEEIRWKCLRSKI